MQQNPKSLTIHFGGQRGRRIRANYLAMTKLSQEGREDPILPGLTSRTRSYTFSYPKGLLFSTQFSQPALALMEMVEYAHLEAQGVVQREARFAGHSLGEYGALGACTTFMPFENLMSLIFYRGLKMQNALARDVDGCTDYSMMAVDPSRIGRGIFSSSFPHLFIPSLILCLRSQTLTSASLNYSSKLFLKKLGCFSRLSTSISQDNNTSVLVM